MKRRVWFFSVAFLILLTICIGLRFISPLLPPAPQVQPVPIYKPLTELDEEKLLPYLVTKKTRIQSPEILELLGTDEYLMWSLEKQDVPVNSLVRYCALSITYYPQIDNSPQYIPEETYTGIGCGTVSLKTEQIELNLDNPFTEDEEELPLKVSCVMFDNPSSQEGQPSSMMYFFMVNDTYVASRSELRKKIGKESSGKPSYFSKIEWKFFGKIDDKIIYPDKQQSIEASEQLIALLLPVLEEEHWPKLMISPNSLTK